MPISLYGGTVTVTVEAALSAATGAYGAWDSGIWDTSTWGPDVTWTDISAYMRSVSTSRRFARELGVWESGTATIVLDNRDGRFDQNNLSGPYVTAGVTGIRPWRPIRIRATYDGVTYGIYRGYARNWKQSTTLNRVGKGDAITTVPCVDELASLTRYTASTISPAGAGESSGARIHRILNAAGHTGERAIDVGRQTMQATALGAGAVALLKLTAESEGGAYYVDRDGVFVFADQYALVERTRSNTSQATWSDDGVGLRYVDLPTEDTGDQIINIAEFSRVGGSPQTATDATSRALYGDSKKDRSDLICESDVQVASLAAIYVQQHKDSENRVEKLVVAPRRDPSTLFPQVLGREVRDLMRAQRHPPGGHAIDQYVHVNGISHQFGHTDWRTTFDLASSSPWTAFTTWDLGLWDTAIFAY